MSDDPKVVSLTARRRTATGDLRRMARHQVAVARQSVDATPEEFARLLEPLLGWTVTSETVEKWETNATPPGDVVMAAGLLSQDVPGAAQHVAETDVFARLTQERYSDVVGVYHSRIDFTDAYPPSELFDHARTVDAIGISLNLLCQQYPDTRLREAVERGTRFRLLFSDPAGESIARYEAEDHYRDGHIASLTSLNIESIIQRVRDRLPAGEAERLQVAVYDETPRFNLIIIDRRVCVMQPYLGHVRGVDSPTFVVQSGMSSPGLYPTLEQTFDRLWGEGKAL